MMERKKILIVDDHTSVREGVKWILLQKRFPALIEEAADVDEAYVRALETKPDLIVMDISLRGSSGIELTHRILQELPHIRVLILSMYSKIHYIVKALEYGATGYILKESPPNVLLKGIEKVLGGEIFIDSRISNKVIGNLLHREEINEPEDNVYSSLTLREQEVLRLTAEGLDSREIGRRLFISPKTVENHQTNIKTKLGCRNTVELVRYAIQIGLVDV